MMPEEVFQRLECPNRRESVARRESFICWHRVLYGIGYLYQELGSHFIRSTVSKYPVHILHQGLKMRRRRSGDTRLWEILMVTSRASATAALAGGQTVKKRAHTFNVITRCLHSIRRGMSSARDSKYLGDDEERGRRRSRGSECQLGERNRQLHFPMALPAVLK